MWSVEAEADADADAGAEKPAAVVLLDEASRDVAPTETAAPDTEDETPMKSPRPKL